MKPKILIIVRGGSIEEIHSDTKIETTIIDFDLRSAGESPIVGHMVEVHTPQDMIELIRIESR